MIHHRQLIRKSKPRCYLNVFFGKRYSPGYLSSAGRKVTICGNIISSNMQMRYAGRK